ncbi:MAG: endonuclease/exonuclease/phosphatase family protein [Victivallales bacterium]|nr:endonuclease/exonuclease/phosphatase family protein [Victivallales bacterium]
MAFNIENYFLADGKGAPKKPDRSRSALNEVIAASSPDVMIFSEVGGEDAIAYIVSRLAETGIDYPYFGVMHGDDTSRHLGYVSRIEPVSVKKIDSLSYRLKPKFEWARYLESVRVQRGFLHVVFEVGGYVFHVIGAHLKSNVPHWRYSQTDMRRMEARLLKYYVNGLVLGNPSANVLVVGDMNDVYSSSPLVALRGMHEKPLKRLFDLRPVDSHGTAWTHWWKSEDSYGRIDYMFVSPSLLPEIDFTKTEVVHPEVFKK